MQNDYLKSKGELRIAIYARVSTEHEAQISALQNQIQYYDNILKNNPDWVLVDRYIDKGITGTSMAKREAFMRMIKDAYEGKFDLILTREVSRFARNTAETLIQVRELAKINVGVYFVADNINTLDPSDDYELRLTIMASLAQNESRKISSRVKAGQKISFQNGVFYGNGNILGYDKQGKNMVINKEQAETVRYIYDLYLQGNGFRAIKFTLEQEGRKTSSGNTKWNQEVIGRILKNKFYCGLIEYRKEYVPDYLVQKKIRNNGEVEKIIVKGTHEPIVTEGEFYRVQEMISSKSRTVNGKTVGHRVSKDVFCRKLKCSCGHTMGRRRSYTTKDGEDHYVYQCYNQLRNGTKQTRKNKGISLDGCCTSMAIPNWKLDIGADWIFRHFFDNKQIIYDKAMKILEQSLGISRTVQEINEQIEECRMLVQKMYEKYDTIVDLYADGDISKELYLQKKAKLESDIALEKEKIEQLEDDLKTSKDEGAMLERKKKIADFLSIKPFSEKLAIPSELIDRYVESILISDNAMVWTINLRNDEISKDENRYKNKSLTATAGKNSVGCSTPYKQLSLKNKRKSNFII